MSDERRVPMIHVRVPDALKDKLGSLAKENGRSMTAEIVQRLEASLDDRNAPHIPETKDINESERAFLQTMRGLTIEQQDAVKEIVRQLYGSHRRIPSATPGH